MPVTRRRRRRRMRTRPLSRDRILSLALLTHKQSPIQTSKRCSPCNVLILELSTWLRERCCITQPLTLLYIIKVQCLGFRRKRTMENILPTLSRDQFAAASVLGTDKGGGTAIKHAFNTLGRISLTAPPRPRPVEERGGPGAGEVRRRRGVT